MEKYNYQKERQAILSVKGQQRLLSMYTKVIELLDRTGAFTLEKAIDNQESVDGTFSLMALLDFMVEIGAIREVTREGQKTRVFVRG